MNIHYFDFHYTVIKSIDDDEIVKENNYIKFNDIIPSNHYIVIKPRETK